MLPLEAGSRIQQPNNRKSRNSAQHRIAFWVLFTTSLLVGGKSAVGTESSVADSATSQPGWAAEQDGVLVNAAVVPAPVVLSNDTNIHYTGKYCDLCHQPGTAPGEAGPLTSPTDYQRMCSCHFDSGAEYPHPTGIEPSEEMAVRIPAEFPIQGGMLDCATCHEIGLQCQDVNRDRFLRGGRYDSRTEICFKCHDAGEYERFNPHNQLSQAGTLEKDKCAHCHEHQPDPLKSTFRQVDFIGDIEELCERCHRVEKHCGGVDHMLEPSDMIRRRIRYLERRYGVVMPLHENGNLTCVTCHNPHEKGVIAQNRPGSRGAGAKLKHRIPGRLCTECHNM